MKLKLKIAAVAAGVATTFAGLAVGLPTANADTASCSAASTDKIREGSRNASVTYAQCLLNAHGNYGLDVDGVFGPATLSAVKDFQDAKGLDVDGVVGPLTWAALTDGGSGEAPDPGDKRQQVVDFAAAQKGKPYVWGANGPDGFDCSGLTQEAFRSVGVELPRISDEQGRAGTSVSAADAEPGDLVHWPGHVGIYAGNGEVWHASGSKQQVIKSKVWDNPDYRSFL